ncbi:MAG: hypothetical protein GF418_13355 [Chitinivibrionales bacterium]|nr:hypothetical protein [Chitinivibrionales bacterium]MBD3396606.1 hypothetical protein [Chitinivibrionales bacterium]
MRTTLRVTTAMTVLAMAVSAFAAEVQLNALECSGKDGVWKDRSINGISCLGIDGTGSSLDGDVWWDAFPGDDGTYNVLLGAVLESDGNSPYELSIAGAIVATGNFPYADGNLNCSGSTYRLEELDLGNHTINNGDKITYWARSVYPCGASHGQYSRFSYIKFVSTGGSVTPPPPPPPPPAAGDLYYEKDGMIVVECESAEYSGDWALETNWAGYSGDGYLRWLGADFFGSPPGSNELVYNVYVCNPGTFVFRYRNYHDWDDHTQHNDHWVSVAGHHFEKTFSHLTNAWNWESTMEGCWCTGEFDLSAGVHTIKIQPRSFDFAIDKLVLYKKGLPLFANREDDPDLAVSPTDAQCEGGGDLTPTVFVSPGEGSTLEMGTTVTLAGTGDNLMWSYDADSDGEGVVGIGSGAEVDFTVPDNITGPMLITIFLNGNGGEASRTFSVVESGGAVDNARRPVRYSIRPRANQIEAVYSVKGAALAKSAITTGSLKAMPAGVVIIRYTDGTVQRLLNGKVLKK